MAWGGRHQCRGPAPPRRLLERLLYDVEPLDPWTFAATALILFAVAAMASYVPASRGMRFAPVDALRTD